VALGSAPVTAAMSKMDTRPSEANGDRFIDLEKWSVYVSLEY